MPRGPKPMRRKLKLNEFYCVKCRKPVAVKEDEVCFRTVNSSKRKRIPMLSSSCSKCQTNLNKIVAESKVERLRDKYGRC